jgi:hypothetical protein
VSLWQERGRSLCGDVAGETVRESVAGEGQKFVWGCGRGDSS